MNRIMALDVGKKRIGIALSDPMKLTASPNSVYSRKSLPEDVEYFLEFARENIVDEILIGYPLYLTGGESLVIGEIKPLYEALKDQFEHDVIWCEERLSSKEAEKIMLEKGYNRKELKENRDSFAAALILTWYLEGKYETWQE
jgi:putative pre-16S rRNA nuclease